MDQQDHYYTAISSRNGAHAYRPREDLSKATCYNCCQTSHLALKRARSRLNAQLSCQQTSLPSMACFQTSEPLDELLVQCAVTQVKISLIVAVDAFPDSGSKHAMLSLNAICQPVTVGQASHNCCRWWCLHASWYIMYSYCCGA